jgi:hypothetical protein
VNLENVKKGMAAHQLGFKQAPASRRAGKRCGCSHLSPLLMTGVFKSMSFLQGRTAKTNFPVREYEAEVAEYEMQLIRM